MQHFTATDGTRLAYRDDGNGIPVICLAGLTRNGDDFGYLAPHIPNVRLIRPDYRGRGASDWADHTTYSIPQEAADVIALMDHLGLERAAILGTSRGGLIAMGLSAMIKDRIIGVCLNDIGPEIGASAIADIMGYLGRRPAHKTYNAAANARAQQMIGFANVPMSRWREEVRIHYREQADGLEITYDPALRPAVEAAGVSAPDLWPFFDGFDGLPLALLRGENSTLLTQDTVDKMQKRRPDMRVAIVPDRAHVPFLDEPVSLDLIHAWLGDLTP